MAKPIPQNDDTDEMLANSIGDIDSILPEDGESSVDEDQEGSDFYDNLAEKIEQRELNAIANELLDLVEKDKQARSKRDEQYADGIKRTGLGNEAPGGAEFTGSSKVVHPVLTEGCIDFAARAIKEIFPANGPCKSKIIGTANDQKTKKAERKKEYMNWQLTKQISEYRDELEQLLTQVPLGGSQYLKMWFDSGLNRARAEFIPIDDIFIPFSVSHFYSAHRLTHRQLITRQTFDERVKSGLYLDISVIDPGQSPDKSKAQEATDKIEGKEEFAYNEDGLRTIYEIQVNYGIDDSIDGGDLRPYLISVDEHTKKVLAIYRNWEEEDERCKKLDCIVEFKFIPWRGAYGIGLPHIIGGMSGALTGALRALLDSAHISTMPGMIKLRGARMSGQSDSVSPTEIKEIEGTANIDDIRKLMMPIPFNPPSTVLFQLLDWLTNQAKGIVATAEEKISDATNNMPVGTTLALIEQGSITYSSIHARMHASQAKVLEILHRINSQYLSDEETIEELGELIVSRSDFEGPMDIVPVSDPNIFSETQRYAQFQAVLQLRSQFPDKFKDDRLLTRGMQMLNFPDPDDVLIEIHQPERMEAIDENAAASEGKPLKAFDDQDHLSHLMTHLHYALSPIFCANPIMAIPALPTLLNHCKEHLAMFYLQNIKAAMGAYEQEAGDISTVDAQMHAAAIADQRMAQQLAPVMQQLEMAQQALQKFSTPPPQDPQTAAFVQVEQAKIKAKSDFDNQKLALENKAKTEKDQADSTLAATEQQAEARNAEMALSAQKDATAAEQQTKLSQLEQESKLELMIEKMRIDAKKSSELNRIEFDRYAEQSKQQLDLLKHILTLINQPGNENQSLGDDYERQQIKSAQADGNGAESNGDEDGRSS